MAGIFTGQELGRARPPTTAAVSVFSPGSDEVGHIKGINISNTTTLPATYRILLDNDGSDVTEAESVEWDIEIKGNTTHKLSYRGNEFVIQNTLGTLSVRSSIGNALTFIVSGAIET